MVDHGHLLLDCEAIDMVLDIIIIPSHCFFFFPVISIILTIRSFAFLLFPLNSFACVFFITIIPSHSSRCRPYNPLKAITTCGSTFPVLYCLSSLWASSWSLRFFTCGKWSSNGCGSAHHLFLAAYVCLPKKSCFLHSPHLTPFSSS